jgi:hypothetical protein
LALGVFKNDELVQCSRVGWIWGTTPNSGQFVLGQPENQRNKTRDLRLPTASELSPELIDAKLDKKDRLPPCSAFEALERQEPFVNQTLAYQALAMLARWFRYGRLSYQAPSSTCEIFGRRWSSGLAADDEGNVRLESVRKDSKKRTSAGGTLKRPTTSNSTAKVIA